ncbi:hypothetical protein F5B22DRAFT_658503 [Xylaria bambusicola]|uniref:uncharacterized protein n=1 Tax=Xylaria bambusicola TaxID=326684 RepID=UPI002007ED88|nr:uncharacterized protein F5B22DRAFT_658503 [Xylaria bambusicola]KAI0525718.1 hypothetical protein F5B22DRAFT_658503 [Xylaria bambusicola]
MEKSLQKYLRHYKVTALENYLDELISKNEAHFQIVGYGISPCNDGYRYTKAGAASDDASLWTHIVISVKGIVSKHLAEDILESIDKEISSKLSPEQKPPRVSYTLDDDSNTLYRARSPRIKGTLPDARGSPKIPAHEETDLTPLGSPRGGYVVKSNFIDVEIAFEDRG